MENIHLDRPTDRPTDRRTDRAHPPGIFNGNNDQYKKTSIYDCFSKIWQLFEARLSKIIWDTVLTLA